jgi:hypothetical protein
MRVYPLGLVRAIRASAGRYGFETEIVTRAGWAGCPVVEVPVACRYLPAGERVSHLRPLRDTLRAVGMHARLLARALLPWPHPKWPAARAEAPAGDGAAAPKRSLHRRLIDWLNPRDAWRQARRDRVSREAFAAGLAVGAFIGNLPTYGVHAFLGLYAARRLHLHPLPSSSAPTSPRRPSARCSTPPPSRSATSSSAGRCRRPRATTSRTRRSSRSCAGCCSNG